MRLDPETVARFRRAIARISRLLNEAATAEGLTPTQASVLGIVQTRRTIGVGELAEIEALNPTMVSRMIGKLDTEGYLRRTQGAADQRTASVEITALGEETIERVRSRRAEMVSALLESLDDGVAESVVSALPALEALAGASVQKR